MNIADNSPSRKNTWKSCGGVGATAAPKCIYVVGPSSSGKTTLCDAFAKECGIPPSVYIKEVARTVMREQGFTRADVDTFEMQSAIMRAQLRAEDAITRNGRECSENTPIRLLSDRSAVDPLVYAASSTNAEVRGMASKLRHVPEFEATLPRYRESLFVMLTPVKEWIVDDGVRSLENPGKYSHHLRDMLDELYIPYREIGEEVQNINSRVQMVRQWTKL